MKEGDTIKLTTDCMRRNPAHVGGQEPSIFRADQEFRGVLECGSEGGRVWVKWGGQSNKFSLRTGRYVIESVSDLELAES